MIEWQSKRYRSKQREGRALPWRPLVFGVLALSLLGVGVVWGALQIVLARDPVLAPAAVAKSDPRLAALPLVEVNAGKPGDSLVVFFTGDNGWQVGDKGFTAELAARGYPVVVLDTLRYFHKPRTGAEAGADLSALIERYSTAWGRQRVIVAGYSFGADAAALALKELTPPARPKVQALALVAPGAKSDLAMHPGTLFDLDSFDARPVEPAIKALGSLPVVCIYGLDDGGAACPRMDTKYIKPRSLPADHLFLGQYARVAQEIAAAPTGR